MKNSHTKGFTLIELLVVISIISFLSSVVLSSLNKARIQARDTQRISDIRQMRIALELYRNANGNYPQASYWINSYDGSWSTLQTALAPYMPKLPKDPVNNATDPWVDGHYAYAYGYDSITYPWLKSYDLVTQFENTSNPVRCSIKNWTFYIGSGVSWCGSYSLSIYTGDY